jgi:hypothetical protein
MNKPARERGFRDRSRRREIDRERVRFVVHRIIYPPERPDDPLPENVVGRG